MPFKNTAPWNHRVPYKNSYGNHDPSSPAYVPGKNRNASSWGYLVKQGIDAINGGVNSAQVARNQAAAAIYGLQGGTGAAKSAVSKNKGQGGSGQKPGAITPPSQRELEQFNRRLVNSEYRPALEELAGQIANANAMGVQSQNAISGWGQEAGQEIGKAGRRNYREVGGIQNNLGGMLSQIAGAAGPMRTNEANRAMMQSAGGSAGLIAGLGAADQGWFNRARDVNAQTTNFYRNNARDQYAQQSYELQQARNAKIAEMRAAQANAGTQAQQTAYENSIAAQAPVEKGQSEQDRAMLRADARATFMKLMQEGVYSLGEVFTQSTGKLTNPADIAAIRNYAKQYYGGKGTEGARRRAAIRNRYDEKVASQQGTGTGS